MTPRDPDFAARVRRSFARQRFMTLLGATIADVSAGAVTISLPLRADLEQQHGYAHAGAAWAIADSAAGYAAQTLMGAEDGVLTVELKINLLAPAAGRSLLARGRVERSGRSLTVGRADVSAVDEHGVETPVATFMRMPGLADAA